MTKKIIFWGMGNAAKRFISQHAAFMKEVEVVGFTDNDKNKKDKWEGYRVLNPDIILDQEYDYILILSSRMEEIRKNLLEQYLVHSEKILSVDDAYQMYVRNIHGSKDGRRFCSASLVSEISFSERMREKNLTDMDNMFSYLYIKDKYKEFIEKHKDDSYTAVHHGPTHTLKKHTPIWICWLQGLENAPDIVKCCMNSIIKNVEGEIHIITYDNYAEYVKINENILEKHKLGIIDRTHFSDIIRLALLCEYGGIWIDATILMMDKGLPEYIYEMPFFMYKVRATLDRGYPDPRLFASWFIKSEKGNPFLNMVYRMHEEWWNTENEIPYALIHYTMRLAWNMYDNASLGTNKDRLNIYDDNCRVMAEMLNKEYDEVFWNMLRDAQPLQKLSWKIDYLKKKGTFYFHIAEIYENLR